VHDRARPDDANAGGRVQRREQRLAEEPNLGQRRRRGLRVRQVRAQQARREASAPLGRATQTEWMQSREPSGSCADMVACVSGGAATSVPQS
jgi:hypothetical protein